MLRSKGAKADDLSQIRSLLKSNHETIDIDSIRDIAICYIHLDDLAYDLDLIDTAGSYYEILVKLCEKNDSEVRTEAIEKEQGTSR